MGALKQLWSLGNNFNGFIIPMGVNLENYGDSITVGQAASDWTTTKLNTYVGLLKTYLSSVGTNRALGGTGVYSASQLASTNLGVAFTGLVTIMSGYNDIRRGGATTINYNKITGAHRHMISRTLADQLWYGDNGIFSNSGTWGAAIGSIALLGGDGTGHRATTGNKTATINGNNFSFGFIGCNPTNPYYNFGSVKITIDGVLYHNITLNDKTDGLLGNDTYQCGIYTVNVFGLTSGNHSLLIEATGDVIFNYMIKLTDLDISNSVAILSPLYSTHWETNSPYNNGTNQAVDMVNSLLRDIVKEYSTVNYKVIFIDSKKYFNTYNDFDTDGIHPIDLGHNHIFLAVKEQIKKIFTATEIFDILRQIVYSEVKNAYRTKTTATDWNGAYGLSSYYLPSNTDGHITIDLPNQTDCDFGIIGFNTTNELANYPNYDYGLYYAGYDSTPVLKPVTTGAVGATIQSGWLTTNSKLRLGRFSGRIKIQYASDGISFIDKYDLWGIDNSALYLNINMIKNVNDKWCYVPTLSSNWTL